MISRLSVKRVTLKASHDRAMELIEAVARMNGFEVTVEMDLDALVRQRTGMGLNRKTVLVQLHKPALMLGSALLDDSLPLLLPLTMILREISDSISELDFPDWDVAKSSEEVNARYCMEVVYRDTVGRITTAIRESPAHVVTVLPDGDQTNRSWNWPKGA